MDAFGIINMNGRVYDPYTAQFFSPDPYVQTPGDWVNYNRYSYCYGNPFKYTDPSGELQIGPFYLSLNIGWSSKGGLSFGISAGVGLENIASVGISIGYGAKYGNFSFTANASLGGVYINGGFDTKSGFIASAGYSFASLSSGLSPINISTNMLSASVDYSQYGGFSANAGGLSYGRDGLSFNPSMGASYSYQGDLGVKKGDKDIPLTEAQKDEIRKKEIYEKETSEQDNNYNFFYKTKDRSLRISAEYIDDGGVKGNTIVINTHGNREYISAPTTSGKMTPLQLHEYLLANNKLYHESYTLGKTITVRLEACNTGNGFAREFSGFNAHMNVVAPSNYITNYFFWNKVDSPGQYLIFYNGK